MTLTENKKISFALFSFFLVFYTIQIPFHTSKPDIIVFAIRSMSEFPILDYAFLNSGTLLHGTALPNHHLGHTIILWLMYKIAPTSLFNTIWPAGFVSAISGAFLISLTFLIWKSLEIDKYKATTIAVVVGFIPSIWEHSIIGEVYVLQLLFILLFLFAFIKDRIILSSLAFMFANLVSPLSALSFGLILLKPISKNAFKNAFITGGLALILYLGVYSLIGSNLLDLFNPLRTEQEGRGIIYRSGMLTVFLALNFNFFIFYLLKGFKFTYNNENRKFFHLIIATAPQLLLLFLGSTFFIELGSFQLPVFWALAFPLGLYLSQINLKRVSFVAASLGLVAVTYFMWILPNNSIGSSREEAGNWLKGNGYKENSVIGSWDISVGVLTGKNSHSLDVLNKYYFDQPCPTDNDILRTEKEKLVIAEQKKIPLRVLLADLNIPGMGINIYEPEKEIKNGTVSKIYENDAVLLYSWEK
ncbi:MAG: hypothetical protein GY936_20645 [Ignavibacteriae bacterium]|nr:hypothetical protein [Ignavibacteriota bacterium]